MADTNGHDVEFLTILEDEVKKLVRNRKTSKETKLAAVNAGAKLLAIRYKISENAEKGFFS